VSLRNWQERIEDILAAIAEIGSFMAGMNREQFLADAKTLKAEVADLTIIGEAARTFQKPYWGKEKESVTDEIHSHVTLTP
jgi:uncharacterized protein with HEPN domain